MINFDLTITLGTIIETAVLCGGGIAALATLRSTVSSLRTEAAAAKKDSKEQFAGIQNELKKMGDILIGMARFDERIANLDKRVTSQGRRIDDLSRGDGFVRGHRTTLDGEYS